MLGFSLDFGSSGFLLKGLLSEKREEVEAVWSVPLNRVLKISERAEAVWFWAVEVSGSLCFFLPIVFRMEKEGGGQIGRAHV